MNGTILAGGYGDGIYVIAVNDGKLKHIATMPGCENPTYLAAYGERVYAVNELQEGSKLTAIEYTSTRELRLINQVCIPGAGACHLSLDKSGKFLFAANYLSGDIISCSIDKMGRVYKVLSHIVQEGTPSHCHCVIPSPGGEHLLAVNLGTDTVYSYKVNQGVIAPRPHIFKTGKGQGPRHLVMDGEIAYLVTETGNMAISLSYDKETGALHGIQKEALLPRGCLQQSYAAGVALSPILLNTGEYAKRPHLQFSRRFMYVSNRGYNHLSVFAVDYGLLTRVGHYPSGGEWPRDLCISPEGDLIVVANQRSNNVACFRLDLKTGAVGEMVDSIKVPSPACVLYTANAN